MSKVTNKALRERARLRQVMARLEVGDIWLIEWSDAPSERAIVTKIHNDPAMPWASSIEVVCRATKEQTSIAPGQLLKWLGSIWTLIEKGAE